MRILEEDTDLKRVTLIATVILLAAVMFAVYAQQPVEEPYVPQPGDDLWSLGVQYRGDPEYYKTLLDLNPFLKESDRMFYDETGRLIVKIYPGTDKLVGVRPAPQRVQTNAIRTLQPIQLNLPAQQAEVSGFNWAYIGIPLLVLLALAAITYAFLRLRRSQISNPATAGPPMMEGGVTSETVADVFRARAATSYSAATGQQWQPRQFRIVDLVSGQGYGVLNVHYRGGRVMPRHLNGDMVYRATMIMPDGSREERYILQRCGNDVDPNYSGIDRYLPGSGFRFVPHTHGAVEVPPTPEPQPVSPIRTMPEFRPSITNTGDNTIVAVMGMEIVVGSANLTAEFSSNTVVLRHPEYGEMTIRRQQPAAAAQTADQQAAAS